MESSDIFFGLFEKSDKGGKNVPTHVESVLYELEFHDILVDVRKTQKFTNRSSKQVELVYKFKSTNTPYRLTVSLFDPETGEKRTMTSKVHTKERAAEKYDDSISSGNQGVLMEREDSSPDLYVLSLGNVKPGVEIEIVTYSVSSSTLENDYEDRSLINFVLTIPSLLAPSFEEEEGEVEVMKVVEAVIRSENALKVTSLSHPNSITFSENEKLWRTKGKLPLNEEIDIQVTHTNHPFCSLVFSEVYFKEYNYAGILTLLPNIQVDRNPSTVFEIVLILDCSGSMAGSRMRCAVETLRLFLQSLDPGQFRIFYNVIRFGTKYKKLFEKSVELRDDANYEKAKHFICTSTSNMGGTNMLTPIKSVICSSSSKDEGTRKEEEEKASMNDYVGQKCCTFQYTGRKYELQRWYNCEQCKLVKDDGFCESCLKTCHDGHSGVSESSGSPSRFFCDCGAENKDCKAMKNKFKKKQEQEQDEDNNINNTDKKLQLFLFTDGEDSNPSEIENILRSKHEEYGLRVFTFGIGEGIDRSFLTNCAKSTNGSACFIERVSTSTEKERMKVSVLRQLSNAFRESITNVTIHSTQNNMMNIFQVNSNNNINEESTSNHFTVPSILFNGRSHHEYVFLQDIPDEIEVRYDFLSRAGVQEKGRIRRITGTNFIGSKVASEYLKVIISGSKEKQEEEVGLHFHIPTKYTSLYLELESNQSVVSELSVEKVRQYRKMKKKEKQQQQQQKQKISKHERRRRRKEKRRNNRRKRRVEADSSSDEEPIISANRVKKGTMVMIDGRPVRIVSVSHCKTGKHGSGKQMITFVDSNGKKVVKAVPATSTMKRVVPEKKEEEGEEDVSEEDDDDDGTTKKKKVPAPKALSCVRKSVCVKNLNEILYSCDMKGFWKCTDKIVKLIGFSRKEEFLEQVKMPEGITIEKDIWLTAVVLAILNRFYKSKASLWRLIYKKSVKNLSERGHPNIVAEAKKAVKKF